MSSATTANLVIGLAVLVLFVSLQLTPRRLRENYRLVIILAIIGVVQFVTFLDGHPHHDGAIIAAVAGSLVLAAVLGAVRAPTVKIWRQDGQLMRRGTWLTAVLWVVAFAAHLGYDYLVAGDVTGKNGTNVGDATVVLYLVVSLAVQRFIMLSRAARQEAAGQLAANDAQVPLR
ncbi:hypothetical protein [Trebonia sp.]|uniref:hypothetical protein n=1 Tax=Trebonia sp. TaxID=2767075 RepID=UPI0026304E43|nr:hypothetical protein [Trebonia sp.]